MDAVKLPVVVGVKATSKLQLAPAATVVQPWWPLGIVKEDAFVPLDVIDEITTDALPVLVRVKTL